VRAAIERSIARVLCRGEQPVLERLHGVADAYPAWNGDGAVDAERQILGAAVATVAREHAERVQVREAAIRIV
jgi:hypothetical protein